MGNHMHKHVKADTDQNLKEFFRQFDVNGDGRLSWSELTRAFKKLGATAPIWPALRAVLRADENGDLCIGEHELGGLMKYAVESGYVVVMDK
ncbi:hypothetical protein NL676_025829 [Syzygium grande]|nr:hypothetical protein NL676_025829 [Syzygium grande]